MKFEDFVKSASDDLGKAIKSSSQNLDIWEGMTHRNTHKVMMLPIYLQYKLLQESKKLVYATWGLAIATIILIGISLFF